MVNLDSEMREQMVKNGELRLCEDCDFETLDRKEWRIHERKFRHTQDTKDRRKAAHVTPEEKYGRMKAKGRI